MVQPDAGRVTSGAADRVDERLPPRAAEEPGIERRQAPVLAVAEEFVGRRADAHVGSEVVAPSPGVKPIRRKADGHVGDETDLARGSGKLPVDVELEPLVIGDALGIRLSSVVRPAPPGGTVGFATDVEGGEFAQHAALPADV